MKEIVVLSCTNRPDSYTFKVSKAYMKLLAEMGISAQLLDFMILPERMLVTETFGNRSQDFDKIIRHYILPYQKFVFVAPEYNGSYPGILKVFLDAIHPRDWANKQACLVGVSNGRAGNLRGMDHLTGVLNYLKMHVFHNKLPISSVEKMLNDEGELVNEEQLRVCKLQLQGFMAV